MKLLEQLGSKSGSGSSGGGGNADLAANISQAFAAMAGQAEGNLEKILKQSISSAK